MAIQQEKKQKKSPNYGKQACGIIIFKLKGISLQEENMTSAVNLLNDFRYLVDDNRAIFLFKDGSQSWVAKEYLIEQEQCESVTIESKVYPGKFSSNSNKDEL